MKNVILLAISFFLLIPTLVFAQKTKELNTITVTAERKADTVFGTWKFSITDYEFFEDKLVLLTFTDRNSWPEIKLVDQSRKILFSYELTYEPQKLLKDYKGNVNVICKNNVFRLKIINDEISLIELPEEDFNLKIIPCVDTIEKDIYFSNYSKDYPEFTYFTFNTADSSIRPFKTIVDEQQMKDYNMELYYLTPQERLFAWRVSDQYHVDKHKVAAVLTGYTNNVSYTPLYAPLFIIKDTVYIFDHYNNAILSYNKKLERLDSITIDYHHPKNWREWKHKIIFDKENSKAYAVYEKGGTYYLKNIDLKTGKVISSFQLLNKYVENIRVKNDYVYYVYRPFESLQEPFVYKELIRN